MRSIRRQGASCAGSTSRTACIPGKGVHVGPNPAARKAANASVRAFLRERLRSDDVEGQR
jgi:hypothetical protein